MLPLPLRPHSRGRRRRPHLAAFELLALTSCFFAWAAQMCSTACPPPPVWMTPTRFGNTPVRMSSASPHWRNSSSILTNQSASIGSSLRQKQCLLALLHNDSRSMSLS